MLNYNLYPQNNGGSSWAPRIESGIEESEGPVKHVAYLGLVHRTGPYNLLSLRNCSIRVKSDGHVFRAGTDFKVPLTCSPATNLINPVPYRNLT